MNRIELLFREYRRNTPITYGEFIEAGMSKEQYLEYLNRCEALRCEIIFNHLFHSYLFERHLSNLNNKQIDVFRKEINRMLELELKDLIEWVQQFFDSQIGFFSVELLLTHYLYGFGSNILNRYIPESFIDCDDFRYEIERYINIKLNEDYGQIFGDDISKLSKSELKQLVDKINDIIENNTKPDEPDFNHYSSIQKWSMDWENYWATEDMYLHINNIEEQIEKNNRQFDPNKNVLNIYAGTIDCIRNHSDEVESINAEIKGLNDEIININVNYCPYCELFFIKYTEYLRYMEKYKALPIIMQLKGHLSNIKDSNLDLQEYSFLSLAGYTVRSKSGLDSKMRQDILKRLIELGRSKYELINHIDRLIEFNGKKINMENAVKKWKEDLDFIRQYQFDQQRQYSVDDIIRKLY